MYRRNNKMSIHTTGRTLVVYLENGHCTALSFCFTSKCPGLPRLPSQRYVTGAHTMVSGITFVLIPERGHVALLCDN